MINVTKKLIRFILQSKNNISKDRSLWPPEWTKIEYKIYDRTIGAPLRPEDVRMATPPNDFVAFQSLLSRRKSCRDFTNITLRAEDLLNLLAISAGTLLNEEGRRAYPSGGMLYPVNVYYVGAILLSNMKLQRRVYHFSPFDNTLTCFKVLEESARLSALIATSYEYVDSASGIIVFTVTPKRNVPKYGWLGVRLGLVEVGAIIQNIYLASTALQLKCCAISGFRGEVVDELLDIDGLNEMSVATVAIGGGK